MPALAHSALGLIIKRFVPQLPLWVILISVNLIDILYFIFFPFNITATWWTHGLIMAVIWSISSIFITWFAFFLVKSKKVRKNKEAISNSRVFHLATIVGLLVFSHWLIDLLGWSISGNAIPLFFDDSHTIMIDVLVFPVDYLLLSALIVEIGPMVVAIIIYVHYIINNKRSKKINEKKS